MSSEIPEDNSNTPENNEAELVSIDRLAATARYLTGLAIEYMKQAIDAGVNDDNPELSDALTIKAGTSHDWAEEFRDEVKLRKRTELYDAKLPKLNSADHRGDENRLSETFTTTTNSSYAPTASVQQETIGTPSSKQDEGGSK